MGQGYYALFFGNKNANYHSGADKYCSMYMPQLRIKVTIQMEAFVMY
jgi:hypothetical protein